ncbi:hypothetical protein HPB47_004801 [Ixodes persulcatus]|uniref:Uncharacterized protein n=1 Tax=Ixodes persulcatus TaxID=34615 RepID=A0AC60PES6_IXOPE|nr:hypothetical protein HPB47_004801 [Ixodes persulcatus]
MRIRRWEHTGVNRGLKRGSMVAPHVSGPAAASGEEPVHIPGQIGHAAETQVAAVDRDPWDRRSAAGPDVDLLRALGQGQDLCPSSAAIRDLCQRCSKMTKDPKAFRMCCTNSKDARTWCASFLDFGLN